MVGVMATPLDPQSAEEKARQLLDNRIESVRSLVRSRQHLADLRDQVNEAEKADVAAYRAALRDGWTADELRKLGVDEPAKKARTRRRSATSRDGKPAKASAVEAQGSDTPAS